MPIATDGTITAADGSPLRSIAVCIARYLYSLAEPYLRWLKNYLLGLLAYVDAQIAWLRAQAAQYDYLANKEQAAWEAVEGVFNELRDEMDKFLENGPLADECPEFYEYFMGPARNIFENSTAMLTIHREHYHNAISYMDELDLLIAYWVNIRTQLVAAIEIIDDAIYMYAVTAAEQVP